MSISRICFPSRPDNSNSLSLWVHRAGYRPAARLQGLSLRDIFMIWYKSFVTERRIYVENLGNGFFSLRTPWEATENCSCSDLRNESSDCSKTPLLQRCHENSQAKMGKMDEEFGRRPCIKLQLTICILEDVGKALSCDVVICKVSALHDILQV